MAAKSGALRLIRRLLGVAGLAAQGAADVLRHHYFSLLSAAVIAAVFVVSMTSASFTAGVSPPLPAAFEQPARPQATAGSTATPEPPPPLWITYYIVEDMAQRNLLVEAILSEAEARFPIDGRTPRESVFFLKAGSADEDRAVAQMIERALVVSQEHGYSLRIVDARHLPYAR